MFWRKITVNSHSQSFCRNIYFRVEFVQMWYFLTIRVAFKYFFTNVQWAWNSTRTEYVFEAVLTFFPYFFIVTWNLECGLLNRLLHLRIILVCIQIYIRLVSIKKYWTRFGGESKSYPIFTARSRTIRMETWRYFWDCATYKIGVYIRWTCDF